MYIIPAIDLLGGRVVRLKYGDYNKRTVYEQDPLETALGFKREGAEFLHVVDLDGAKNGSPANRDIIKALAHSGLKVEVGGGLRCEEDVARALELGVHRVILGTAAAREPQFAKNMVEKFGDKIAVGVDAHDGKVAVAGWLEVTSIDSFEFVRRMRDIGVGTVIYTDISRDGAMDGTNIEAYRVLSSIDGINVIASGGVTSEEDIIALRELRIHGAIVGKALYEGRLSLGKIMSLSREGEQLLW